MRQAILASLARSPCEAQHPRIAALSIGKLNDNGLMIRRLRL